MCSISYICHFYSTAIWLVQPLITSCLDNCNKFHTVLASALAPSIPNINSYPSGKKPQDYVFFPLYLPRMYVPHIFTYFSPSYHFIPFIRTHIINFLTNCVHLLFKIWVKSHIIENVLAGKPIKQTSQNIYSL